MRHALRDQLRPYHANGSPLGAAQDRARPRRAATGAGGTRNSAASRHRRGHQLLDDGVVGLQQQAELLVGWQACARLQQLRRLAMRLLHEPEDGFFDREHVPAS